MAKNDESLAGFRPVYGEEQATPEEVELCYVCAYCDEVKKDHMPDGACYFSPTSFATKRIFKYDSHGQAVETDLIARMPKK